jgi:hypothetical protein
MPKHFVISQLLKSLNAKTLRDQSADGSWDEEPKEGKVTRENPCSGMALK